MGLDMMYCAGSKRLWRHATLSPRASPFIQQTLRLGKRCTSPSNGLIDSCNKAAPVEHSHMRPLRVAGRHTPRPLHEKATRSSSLPLSQRTRPKPCASTPHSRYRAYVPLHVPGQAAPHLTGLLQQRGPRRPVGCRRAARRKPGRTTSGRAPAHLNCAEGRQRAGLLPRRPRASGFCAWGSTPRALGRPLRWGLEPGAPHYVTPDGEGCQ